MRTCTLTVAFAILMMSVRIAHGSEASGDQQNPPRLTELSLEQLGDVMVTSVSKQPEEVWHTAVAIYVISREDIRRSAATSIPEVLRLAPGLEVSRIDSDHWAIGIRGFGDQFSKSLLVLMDGRSLYTPLFAGMYWPAHDALLDDIDRIEVIRGPGGTIWGANAVNGVINIITRSAADTHGTLVSAGAGSVDRGAGAIRYGGGNGNGFDYRAYAKGMKRGPQFHADGADFDAWWTAQAGFRTDWSRSGQNLTVQGDLSTGRHGQRVSVSSLSPPSQVSLDGDLEATGANLLARWDRDLVNGQGLRVQAYYDRTSWLAPHFGETRNTFDVDFMHSLSVTRRHGVTWGANAHASPSEFIQTLPSLAFNQPRHTDSSYGAFAQDEMTVVLNRLWLTVGSKFERNNYSGFEAQPSVRLLWMPRPAQTVWSSVSRAVRTPSGLERGLQATSYVGNTATGIPVFLQIIGNDAFKAERLIGYEAGYLTLVTPRVYVDVAAFHNDHDRLSSFGRGATIIEQNPLRGILQIPYVNGVSGTSDGAEISSEWRSSGRWQMKGAYSFVRFNLVNTPGSIDVNAVARYEGSSPHHQARLQSHLALPRGAEIDVAYRYVARLMAQPVPAYHTADLRLGWRSPAGLELFAAGQNLLQPHHLEFTHSPPPLVGIARSVYVGITWLASVRRP